MKVQRSDFYSYFQHQLLHSNMCNWIISIATTIVPPLKLVQDPYSCNWVELPLNQQTGWRLVQLQNTHTHTQVDLGLSAASGIVLNFSDVNDSSLFSLKLFFYEIFLTLTYSTSHNTHVPNSAFVPRIFILNHNII